MGLEAVEEFLEDGRVGLRSVLVMAMERSTVDLYAGLLAGFLTQLFPNNGTVAAVLWLVVAGLFTDLIWRAPATARWRRGMKMITSAVVVAVGFWLAASRFFEKPAIPNDVISRWGSDGEICGFIIAASPLAPWADSHSVVVVCGISRPNVDSRADPDAAYSEPQPLTGSDNLRFELRWSESMRTLVRSQKEEARRNIPTAEWNTATFDTDIWYYAMLVPQNLSTTGANTVQELVRRGAILLDGKAAEAAAIHLIP